MSVEKPARVGTAIAAVAATLALGACSKSPQPAADAVTKAACNRQCLVAATDQYVAALVAHDPSRAPLAENIVIVENVTKMQPGEGLWKNIVKGPDTFAIHVPDEINQTAGLLAMVTQLAPPAAPQNASPEQRAELAKGPPVEQPAIIAVRLKFNSAGKIEEAEHLISGVREAMLANLQTPRPGIFTEIPEASRMSHDELVRIGKSYYDALDDNNGELTPFAPDCERHENGMITAGGQPSNAPVIPGTTATPQVSRDCREQLNSNTFQYIDRIENRRVFAADPQTGLVMGLSHFRHPMDNLPYKVKAIDGSTIERNKDNLSFAPFDLPAAHIFKIGADGLMHEIEAMGFTAPYNSPTGWE
ncbi:MAG TPA: hypothetical protein VNQ32_07200 [Steroidobacteraceae bacterium]|nr:hypothetical protein [Steroidobacteraceae bacterium]